MSKQVEAQPEVLEFTGKRIRYFSARSFDEVLAKLRSRMGKISMADVFDPSGSKEDFEKEVQKHTGESGFMLFVEMNHGAWIKNFGIQRRLVRWIFGNPLVAITMLRHDYTAGLFVPPDLLLAESDDGTGCNVTYVLPSSLIAIEANAALSSAALDLDAKVEAFVSSAVANNATDTLVCAVFGNNDPGDYRLRNVDSEDMHGAPVGQASSLSLF